MKTLDKLKAVRELLSVPSRHTQGDFAKRADGQHTYPGDPHAVCWCLIGAATKAEGATIFQAFTTPTAKALDRAAIQLSDGLNVPAVNDGYGRLKTGETGYLAVLKIIDKAIAMQ